MPYKLKNRFFVLLKEFLKHILPIPTKSFYREINNIKEVINNKIDIQYNELLNEVSKKIKNANEELSDNNHNAFLQINEEVRLLQQKYNEIINQISDVEEHLLSADQEDYIKIINNQDKLIENLKIHYFCDHEVRHIMNNGFYEYREKSDYLDKYKKLVHNLDDISINTINKILSRHKIVMNRADEEIDLFSVEEQSIINKQRTDFYSNILEIIPGVFACGKYLLSTPNAGLGFIETTAFNDFSGLKKLRNIDKIRSKAILDIGAFIGDTSIVFSQFTDDIVYAFEPGIENFEALKKTISLNSIKNIVPVWAGVGAENSTGKISTALSMGAVLQSNDCEDQNNALTEVPIISIDNYVEENNVQVGLIKVDIEGYEIEFLKGAEKTIKNQRPALLLSMYHSASDFFELKPLIESWNLGYTFQVHKEINEHIHYDTMLIAEIL